ncbi:hypothetical protein Tco_0785692, partial [Tanacetum coccineum]
MFIEQSHDEVYGCLKGGSGNSGGKILAISMVEEAWLSEKEERQLEAGQLMASRERAGLTDRIRRLGRENLREEFCQIRRDRDDARRRLRRLESFVERR